MTYLDISKALALAIGYLPEHVRTYGVNSCLLYTSPSPRDGATSRMPSSA